jgi:hypothetical protein
MVGFDPDFLAGQQRAIFELFYNSFPLKKQPELLSVLLQA